MTYVEPGGGPPDDNDSRPKIRPAGPLMTVTRRFGRNGTVYANWYLITSCSILTIRILNIPL